MFTVFPCIPYRKLRLPVDSDMRSPHQHTVLARLIAQGHALNDTRLIAMVVSMWFVLVGAGFGVMASNHSCGCPSDGGEHSSGHLALLDAHTIGAHGDATSHADETHGCNDACSCACGAESPLDCECEVKPYDSMPGPDAMASTSSTSIVGLVSLYRIAPGSAPAGFSPDTPPGNWLYSRPPPISRYLLHRTLLL